MSTMQTISNTAAPKGVFIDRGVPARSAIFTTALVCLGVAYVLSWVEMGLALLGNTPEPAAPMIVSHLLLGALYVCVGLRLQWARWITVVLGIGSVIMVAPMIGAEWHAIPLAAMVTGAALLCKLAASAALISLGWARNAN